MNFAFTIMAILVLIGAGSFYIFSENYYWIGAIPLGLAVGVYMVRDALNEWRLTNFPVRLSKEERNILTRFFPFYNDLSLDNQKRFEQRMTVFNAQKVYQMRGVEEPPADIVTLVTASAIRMTFGLDNYIMPKLGMIIFFAKTFITPEYSHRLHAGEFNADDYNTVLIAVNAGVDGMMKSEKFYNIVIHILAVSYQYENGIKDEDVPKHTDTDLFLQQLCLLRKFKYGFWVDYLGKEEPDVFAICVEHFFSIPERLKTYMPELYEYLQRILKIDPLNKQNPLIIPV